jgi:hypothetical protein
MAGEDVKLQLLLSDIGETIRKAREPLVWPPVTDGSGTEASDVTGR